MHNSISNVPHEAKSSNKTAQYVNILLLLQMSIKTSSLLLWIQYCTTLKCRNSLLFPYCHTTSLLDKYNCSMEVLKWNFTFEVNVFFSCQISTNIRKKKKFPVHAFFSTPCYPLIHPNHPFVCFTAMSKEMRWRRKTFHITESFLPNILQHTPN